MHDERLVVEETTIEIQSPDGSELLRSLVAAQPATSANASPGSGVIVGTLIGIVNDGRTPLVRYPGQPGVSALAARSVVDLYGPHVGASVVLAFDGGDPRKPLVMGVIKDTEGLPIEEQAGNVEVDADGQRLIITAKEQLVLRCGKASITLTKAGKVLIQGNYVLSRSTGVNRIKGGAVQIN